MDSDINKENVSLDKDKQKVLFEYDPKYPIATSTDNIDPTTTEQEERAQLIVNKIRNDKERANRVNYPWESDEEVKDNIPPSANKKYEKKTYSVTPARVKEIGGKSKADMTTYIIVNNYSEPPKEDPLGKPSSFIPKLPSPYTNNGKDHWCGWPFKMLPNYGGKPNLDAVKARPIPGTTNANLPENILAPIKSTNRPGSNTIYKLYREASAAFNQMYDAAKSDGITIYTTSAYRNYSQQVSAYKKYGPRLAAKPGDSNHGFGKAIDVWPSGDALNCKDSANGYGHGAKKWINLNGDRFGWYWGDAPNESWHFVYVW